MQVCWWFVHLKCNLACYSDLKCNLDGNLVDKMQIHRVKMQKWAQLARDIVSRKAKRKREALELGLLLHDIACKMRDMHVNMPQYIGLPSHLPLKMQIIDLKCKIVDKMAA